VARIDTPLLDSLELKFFHQLIFGTPQLAQFISRTPSLETLSKAHVVLSGDMVGVTLPPLSPRGLRLEISCRQLDWCDHDFLPPHWQDDIEDGQWLEVLHPFTSVKNLYLSWKLTLFIGPALQELVGGRVIEVLSSLQSLFLGEVHPSGPVQEAIGKFVAARQLASHLVTVSHWKDEWLEVDD
jgi:hypothetical protein